MRSGKANDFFSLVLVMDGGINSSAAVKKSVPPCARREVDHDKCTILRKIHFCCSTDFRLQAIAQLRENAEAEVFWISTYLVADLNHRKQASQKHPELDCEYIHRLNLGVARTGLQNMP